MSSSYLTYPLASSLWREGGVIDIHGIDNVALCSIPVGSLQASGDLSWQFVFYCIEACVETTGRLYSNDAEVNASSPVVAGKYIFRGLDDASLPVSLRRGPFGKRRGRPAGADDDASSMSDSKRSSINQTKLRWFLVARDGQCLITDVPFTDCTASHIVPYSRLDILLQVLGSTREWPFEPWMGLLLEDSIHHAYDRYDISIYPRGEEEWVIHVFYDPFGKLMQYHGKSFTQQRFHLPSSTWPKRSLLLWQHQQCIQMHYRGYSHRMTAADDYPVVSA